MKWTAASSGESINASPLFPLSASGEGKDEVRGEANSIQAITYKTIL
jgi:hypothetical protein